MNIAQGIGISCRSLYHALFYVVIIRFRHYKIAIEIYQKNLEATGTVLNQPPAVMQPIIMQAPMSSVGYIPQVMNPVMQHQHHMSGMAPMQMHQQQHGMMPMMMGAPVAMGSQQLMMSNVQMGTMQQPMMSGTGMVMSSGTGSTYYHQQPNSNSISMNMPPGRY